MIRVALPEIWEVNVDRRRWLAVAVCTHLVTPDAEGELGEMARYLVGTFSLGTAVERFRLGYPAIFGGVFVMSGRSPVRRFEFRGYVKRVPLACPTELNSLKDLDGAVIGGERGALTFSSVRKDGYVPVDNVGLRFITDTPPSRTVPFPRIS
ncbi:hypothetical protein HS1genome_1377 [Sulfodiicoccus acidiphilus]|uniref:Uncharacterized protein n=1 Tax=Sulfodiicoccus acidiphilus TaxID=1670455 RepID=A0A348B486_9CREN|nr:hypothetical protein [Sulfodiicoccus acidiphilus]BBD72988.1 hypothetical protein HS1genome_1377 [Sulfodiicoccus acidiphilus]GGT87531.1 hypothetical protein GCM10007116_01800 [Sulfodiicoccus acidiphilus]